MQRIDLLATVGVLVRVGVRATLGVSRAVPSIALAGGGLDNLSHRVVDGQVHGHDTVTAVDIFERFMEDGVLKVGDAVPDQTVAGGLVNRGVGKLVNSQQQRRGGDATGTDGVRMDEGERSWCGGFRRRQGESVAVIHLTLAYGVV